MSFDLDAEEIADLMNDLGHVLIEHLGFSPDFAIILRHGEIAQTIFAAAEITEQHPVERLRDLLKRALRVHEARHQ